MESTKFCVLDLETTGLSKQCRIVEICVAACESDEDGNLTILDKYLQRTNPGIPIPAQASAVHGIHDRHVEDCPSFNDIAKDVAKFLSKWMAAQESQETTDIWVASEVKARPVLVGHNIISYDMPILKAHFADANVPFPAMPLVDTLKLARARWPKHPDGNKLVTCCARVGVNELNDSHGANADVLVNAALYARMLTGKEYEPTAESVAAKVVLDENKAAVDDVFSGFDFT